MKVQTIKRILVTFCVNHILAGAGCFALKRRLLNTIGYEIGAGTKIVGPIFSSGVLKVGKDCWIGKNLTVNGNGTVRIGDRCDIAPEVTFLTGGHKVGNASRRAGEGEEYSIEIGDGTWIGARATLGKTLNIGAGCVVAACACVMQDVPDNTMVGGVPAKTIKELEYASSSNASQ